MPRYVATDIKRVIRHDWDLPILEAVSEQLVGPSMTYFGLPGPDLEDLHDWKEYLGPCTCVEKETDPNIRQEILTNSFKLGFQEQGFQLLLGDIDDILINWRDAQTNPAKPSRDWYDLFNLDYCGGWLYKGRSGRSKRFEAFGSLIRRQRASASDGNGYFLLLMTVNVRSRDRGEIPEYTKKDLSSIVGEAHAKAIGSLPQQGVEHWHLKYYIIYNLVQLAISNGFAPFVFPPLFYRSGKSYLVHFVSVFACTKGQDAVVVPKQSNAALMRLPLATIENLKVGELPSPRGLGPFCDSLHPLRRYLDEMMECLTDTLRISPADQVSRSKEGGS